MFRDGLKAIDVESAAKAHPSYMATGLDIGDVVFKYSAVNRAGSTSGFEPMIVELIEEFETERGSEIVLPDVVVMLFVFMHVLLCWYHRNDPVWPSVVRIPNVPCCGIGRHRVPSVADNGWQWEREWCWWKRWGCECVSIWHQTTPTINCK